ncbi:hypothetical protein SAVIM338S_04524 [Streptomyces avidinii]
MAPQPNGGAPRWDGRTQRWVSDGQPEQPPAHQPPAQQPQGPQDAHDQNPHGQAPGLASPPAPPGYGPPPPPPPYGPQPPYEPEPPYGPQAPYGPQPPYGPPDPAGPVHDPYADPVPPGPPRPDGPRARWLTPTTAVVAVAALAIGAAAVWFVQRDTGETPLAGPTVSSAAPSGDVTAGPSATGTGAPPPSGSSGPGSGPSASPSASESVPHETVRDAKGFTIAVPVGWSREEGPGGVFYRSADRAALLQVFTVVEPELSPLGAVQGASADLGARTAGYEEVGVGPVPGATEAAELVYEYDSAESRGRRRGVERVFFAQDGKKWAVLTAGPAAGWTLTREHHTAALAAFRPGG